MPSSEASEIRNMLDDIRAILLLVNADKIEDTKRSLLKSGSEQEKIYLLCEGKTTQEIAQLSQKSEDYVNANLSLLRKKGLVRSFDKDGRRIHEQRF